MGHAAADDGDGGGDGEGEVGRGCYGFGEALEVGLAALWELSLVDGIECGEYEMPDLRNSRNV